VGRNRLYVGNTRRTATMGASVGNSGRAQWQAGQPSSCPAQEFRWARHGERPHLASVSDFLDPHLFGVFEATGRCAGDIDVRTGGTFGEREEIITVLRSGFTCWQMLGEQRLEPRELIL